MDVFFRIQQILEAPFQKDLSIRKFKPKEVSNIVQKVGKMGKKMPDYDLITENILKELPEEGIR